MTGLNINLPIPDVEDQLLVLVSMFTSNGKKRKDLLVLDGYQQRGKKKSRNKNGKRRTGS